MAILFILLSRKNEIRDSAKYCLMWQYKTGIIKMQPFRIIENPLIQTTKMTKKCVFAGILYSK
jgi:hypothetical protein